MPDLFCKDCKHSLGDGFRMICESPHNAVDHVAVEKYLVTGEHQPTVRAMRGANCLALRTPRHPSVEETVCGTAGKWFEQKET